MKVYISADMEGIAYINHWDEVDKTKEDYEFFREEMTREVATVCNAINEKYYDVEIYVRDCHWSARNIIPDKLSDNVKLIRGWAETPYSQVDLIDNSFDCAIFIGYHSGGHSNKNPLSHTIEPTVLSNIKINGEYVSEFEIYAMACSYHNVPVIFTSGDEALCQLINEKYPSISTLSVIKGIGGATINLLSSNQIQEKLREKILKRLERGRFEKIEIPKEITMEIRFTDHKYAQAMSYFPNAKRVDEFTISYTSTDYFDILRFKFFALKIND